MNSVRLPPMERQHRSLVFPGPHVVLVPGGVASSVAAQRLPNQDREVTEFLPNMDTSTGDRLVDCMAPSRLPPDQG